jgi:hypothetical protein
VQVVASKPHHIAPEQTTQQTPLWICCWVVAFIHHLQAFDFKGFFCVSGGAGVNLTGAPRYTTPHDKPTISSRLRGIVAPGRTI